jgi:starch phosphorylase
LQENLEILHRLLLYHLNNTLAKDMYSATTKDKFDAAALSIRELLAKRWITTQQEYYIKDTKRIYYLSLEFLIGRLLQTYVINLGLANDFAQAVEILGLSHEEVVETEWEAGLGNGGLGRLAACFLDSLAAMQYPAYGYGIRYEYGIFSQKIKDGYQLEAPDNWLRYGNSWEFPRPELLYTVKFYGKVNTLTGANGKFRMEWAGGENVMAMAYDYPVPGFRNETVNTLRLWAAKSTREFDLEYFNSGDYVKAVEDKSRTENISKVLYPNDQSLAGKELRLKQQFFFVSATLRDIVRRYKKSHKTYRGFPDKVAVQLNDTHPSIAIAELMRILVDEENLAWETAWSITNRTFAYTNHTILPEALETWPEGVFGNLLPRHLQVIQEIDRRFMVQVDERFPDQPEEKKKMAIITGDGNRVINMARLAIVGSHAVNGVSELHTEILKKSVFESFTRMTPEKFQNITNGVTPRRWLLQANPELAGLITEAVGNGWTRNLSELKKLEPLADDGEFCAEFRAIKKANKTALATYLTTHCQVSFNPGFFLDCQVKRFHEYKRQLLNVLHVITLYNRITESKLPESYVPRTILFAGKSAPGYFMCKLIIKLIHNIGAIIENDPLIRERLRVVFVPNYGVALAQKIIPAAELSEQISTAGYEASGTGNMKFTLNGALTIGTLDGANIEIREEVGPDNFFNFGLTAEEIGELCKNYNPHVYYEWNAELKKALDQLASGYFSPGNPSLFQPIVNALMSADTYFVLADYDAYVRCQEEVSRIYQNEELWSRMAVLNIARSGKFSSDRAIQEYADRIWQITPVKV